MPLIVIDGQAFWAAFSWDIIISGRGSLRTETDEEA
jgi:hypothetical protein